MREWFVRVGQRVYGPFELADIRRFADKQWLKPDSFLRKGNQSQWEPASNFGFTFGNSSPQSVKLESRCGRSSPSETILGATKQPSTAATALWVAAIISCGLFASCVILAKGFGSRRLDQIEGKKIPAHQMADKPVGEATGAEDLATLRRSSGSKVRSANPNDSSGQVAEERSASHVAARATSAPAREDSEGSGTQDRSQQLEVKNGPNSFSDLISEIEPAVAFIRGRTSSGTGFVVAPGVIATNKHVIELEQVEDIGIRFASADREFKELQAATIVFEDPKRDLAFLRIPKSPPPLRVANTHAFRRGEEIAVIGYPSSIEGPLENAVSRGILSTQTVINERPYYQLGISVNPGNSGGPVFNMAGQVIGVVTLRDPKREGLGFCIPSEDLNAGIRRMAEMKEDEVTDLNARHSTKAVFGRIVAVAAASTERMELLTTAMRDAVDRGGSANDGIAAVLQARNKDVLPEADFHFLDKSIRRICQQPRITTELHTRLADFWQTTREAVDYAERPRGNISSYQRKSIAITEEIDRQFGSLRALIGLPWE